MGKSKYIIIAIVFLAILCTINYYYVPKIEQMTPKIISITKPYKIIRHKDLSNDDFLAHGNPILTKTIICANTDKIVLQLTLWEDGMIIYNGTQIQATPDEFKEMILLKNQMIKEGTHCCPDHNHTILGTPYIYLHDIDKQYVTNGSCLKDSMVSFYKLNNMLKNIVNPDPDIWT